MTFFFLFFEKHTLVEEAEPPPPPPPLRSPPPPPPRRLNFFLLIFWTWLILVVISQWIHLHHPLPVVSPEVWVVAVVVLVGPTNQRQPHFDILLEDDMHTVQSVMMKQIMKQTNKQQTTTISPTEKTHESTI